MLGFRRSLYIVSTSLLVACAPKADLDKAMADVARLSTEVEALTRASASQQATIADLQKRLAAAQEQLQQAEQRVSATSEQLASTSTQLSSAVQQLTRKPALPVSVSFRRAALGPGFVARFATTVKQDVPVQVTVKSLAFGSTKQVRLHLHSAGLVELGHAEGVALEPGDELLLENQAYSPTAIKVVAP